MRRLHNLYAQVTAFDNLLLAYRKARRGKGRSADVARFALNLEPNLFRLEHELKTGCYRPGRYRLFTLYERKPRLIAAAPFRDRVVHHAAMNVIEPPLDRRFIHDSYACRKGKGVHAAVTRYQNWSRNNTYALKLDVQRYFPSIDHQILKEKLARRIKDRNVLALLARIIDAGPTNGPTQPRYFPGDDLLTPLERRRGIPIGNLTSQFFANLYLDALDHHIKETLGVTAYLRYVDDMVILGNDKDRLHDLRGLVSARLAEDRLCLHPGKAQVTRVRDGLDLLGYRVFPNRRRLRNDNGFRFRRRLRSLAEGFADGRLSWDDVNASVQSWIGHAQHADTWGLRRRIFSEVVFSRGGTDRMATGA